MATKSQKPMSIADFLTWLYKERNFSLISGIRNFREKKYLDSVDAVNK